MKSIFVKSLVVIFIGVAQLVPARVSSQVDARQYVVIEYIKVKPSMRSNFLKLQKDLWRKVEQERLKQGKINTWELYEVLYPSGTSAEYNFVIYHRVKGWNTIEGLAEGTDDIIKKVLTKEQVAMLDKSSDIEEVTRREIWLVEDKIARADYVPPSKYHLANFMNVLDGKWDAYLELEKTLVKPVHEEQARIGGRAGWTLLALREPEGSARPYQAATFDLFDRWSDIAANDLSDFYSQIHPGKSPEYFSRQITDTRALIRQEVRKLIDYVQ